MTHNVFSGTLDPTQSISLVWRRGLTNTVTAVKNAQMAESAVLLIGGAAATLLKGRGALQDIDQMTLFRPLCKFSASVRRLRDIRPTITRALHIAQSGTPGNYLLTRLLTYLLSYCLRHHDCVAVMWVSPWPWVEEFLWAPRRLSSQPVSWLSTKETKPIARKANIHLEQKNTKTQNKNEKLKPGLVTSYDLQPGNAEPLGSCCIN